MSRATLSSVEFGPLLEQPPDVIEHIRNLRNSPGVRMHMYTDHEISFDEHARWLERLRQSTHDRVMVIRHEGAVEGLVGLHAIDKRQRSAEWAFYLSDAMQGKGVGSVVEFKLLDLAFGEVALEKLNCEVLASNTRVVDMHRKFGFAVEGVRRRNVIKDGQREDVVLLGLLSDEWREARGPWLTKLSA